MVCCIVLRPVTKCQTLLFNRHRQALLSGHLELNLSYKPFIFNSTKGTYIFVKKKDSFDKIEKILIKFLSQSELDRITLHDTSFRPNFFRNVTEQVLTSEEISALGWKRYISSFLLQVDPYDPSTSPHSIKVYKRFRNNIKLNGTKFQRKFFKRRMKMLRDRVSLKSIEDLLKLD